jgi:hypothetical protein
MIWDLVACKHSAVSNNRLLEGIESSILTNHPVATSDGDILNLN